MQNVTEREKKMDYEKLFELANPYLEKNDFGVAHTRRVFDIAKKNFFHQPSIARLNVFFHNSARYRRKQHQRPIRKGSRDSGVCTEKNGVRRAFY